MEFDTFDREMRAVEKAFDRYIDPNMLFCARLDGRGFSNLTEKISSSRMMSDFTDI